METATNADKSKSNVDGLISGTPDDHVEETVSIFRKYSSIKKYIFLAKELFLVHCKIF